MGTLLLLGRNTTQDDPYRGRGSIVPSERSYDDNVEDCRAEAGQKQGEVVSPSRINATTLPSWEGF